MKTTRPSLSSERWRQRFSRILDVDEGAAPVPEDSSAERNDGGAVVDGSTSSCVRLDWLAAAGGESMARATGDHGTQCITAARDLGTT